MTSDENAIRNLAGRYARAAMEHDCAAFADLWWKDGIWDIGGIGPTTGRDAIVAQFDALLSGHVFFLQLPTGGVVEVDGATATSSWVVEERARTTGGDPYRNVSSYDDVLERRGGGWRYIRRTYRFAWVDQETPVRGEMQAIAEQDA